MEKHTFTDLRLVEIDAQRTKRIEPGSALFSVYIKLSGTPPPGWTELFEHLWKQRFYAMRRETRIEGACVVIRCVPDELEMYHKEELQQNVADTNESYRASLERRRQAEQAEAERAQAERQQIEELRKRVKFD